MILTSLKKRGNDILLLFDDGTSSIVDYRVVVDFGLRRGDSFDDDKKELLINESSFLKAKDSIFRFLANRLHSKYELKIKLRKKKYSEEIIERAIADLSEKGFIKEDEFVSAFVSQKINQKKWGINKIRMQLYSKGIDKELVESYLQKHIGNESIFENAYALALKKYESIKNGKLTELKTQQKIFSFLLNRGFDSDIIKAVLRKIFNSDID